MVLVLIVRKRSYIGRINVLLLGFVLEMFIGFKEKCQIRF